MRIKNYFQLICAALIMSFAITSCGDDDPVTPTPDPSPDPTPDPTPTVVYNGYGCAFSLDSVAGDAEAFNTIILDSMKFYCPELKEKGAGVYGASIVYEKNDTADYKKLREGFRAFELSVLGLIKTAKTPVVTSSAVIFSNNSQSGVSSDWSFDFSASSSSRTFGVLIPQLKSSIWATDDKKDTGVESVKFDSWVSTAAKALFSGSVVINDIDTYPAVRLGDRFVLLGENNEFKYVFFIDPSGESFRLTQIGGEKLADEAVTTYTFKE